jgi:hypothetical protein
MALLRSLIRHHGLTVVFVEGVPPADLVGFRDAAVTLRGMEAEEIPRLRRKIEEARELGQAGESIVATMQGLLDDHQRRLLMMGSAGRLLMSGELDDVAAMEDPMVFAAADPVTADGAVEFDAAKREAREDALVRAMLAPRRAAVCVLGGDHNLADNVHRLAGDRCEYLRVTTAAYRAAE